MGHVLIQTRGRMGDVMRDVGNDNVLLCQGDVPVFNSIINSLPRVSAAYKRAV